MSFMDGSFLTVLLPPGMAIGRLRPACKPKFAPELNILTASASKLIRAAWRGLRAV